MNGLCNRLTFTVIVLMIFPAKSIYAQDVKQFAIAGISPAFYIGDLKPETVKWTAIGHLGIRFNQREKINGTFNISFGSLTGQERLYQYYDENNQLTTPNTFFHTSVISFHYDLGYNFIRTDHWLVFAGAGIGIIRYEPKDDLGNRLIEMSDTRANGESYTNTSVILPLKAGVIYLFDNDFGVFFHAMMMNPQTDYIDNLSLWGRDTRNDNYYQFVMGILVPLRIHVR